MEQMDTLAGGFYMKPMAKLLAHGHGLLWVRSSDVMIRIGAIEFAIILASGEKWQPPTCSVI